MSTNDEPPVAGAKTSLAKRIREASIEILAAAVVIAVPIVIVTETFSSRTIIEPFLVPKELADAGFTGEVVARRVLDEVARMQKRAASSVTRTRVENSLPKPEPISLPGTSISVYAVSSYLKEFLCGGVQVACDRESRIGGEIVIGASGPEIRVRPLSRTVILQADLHDFAKSKGIDRLIEIAAMQIVLDREPIIMASYLHETAGATGEAFVRLIQEREQPGSQVWLRTTNLLGVSHRRRNDFEIAANTFAMGLNEVSPKFRPEAAILEANFGRALRAMGHSDHALARYCRAIRLNPRRPNGYNGVGEILLDLGRASDAIAFYRHAVELDPTEPDWRANLAAAIAATKDFASALKEVELALSLSNDHVHARQLHRHLLSQQRSWPLDETLGELGHRPSVPRYRPESKVQPPAFTHWPVKADPIPAHRPYYRLEVPIAQACPARDATPKLAAG